MDDAITAAILGIIEGITEYLPVSSTGHLVLFNDFLHFKSGVAETFDVVIQSGAILSVIILYWPRFRTLLADAPINRRIGSALFGNTDARAQLLYSVKEPGLFGNAGLAKLALASVPPALVGLFAHDWIKANLFESRSIAVALIAGAIAMLWADWRTRGEGRTIDSITSRDAIIIGLFQCVALWPGMSRAAWTIIGGLLIGLSRRGAAEFSFLAAVPLILAASGYDFYKSYGDFTADDFVVLAAGLSASFITAFVTVAAFISFVQRVSLRPFAVYRLALGAAVLLFIAH